MGCNNTCRNIIAKLKGSGSGKALMLLTHYDSNPHSSVGASDAGSGMVRILEELIAFLQKNET
jgi:Zn-dependent M28 family amino/carboxypeptidase